MNVKIQLKTLEDWVKKQGYQLAKERNEPDELFMHQKKIVLCTRSTPINQVYSLLHECRTLSDSSKEKIVQQTF